ncbi:F0F1 ATP synthase subunit epsilon [Actinobacteria bacterium YIM 96077]|uniref:ATP synthase epsilon chain n=1 Tax=Phytoactinopolyspora halophila TaxID=1981511 RepID=A0A329QS20_9ACTN|nr:F0F1 ATP synthase subunit epsilon [Phytoactinopolyspora halophila]AYY15627.1 F0F1 ATP synthase subunit epsilon [Actinobacteria bacterium YIM 96077]RAW14896.1 F0F1 ATP synthase subunit epsilon [Phytoactinopolyspora halophila]
MAGELNVELVAADRQVWSGAASLVVAKTTEGEIGIMAGHEPVLAVLVPGPVTVRTTDGEAVVAAVDGGFLSVSQDHVAVLAEMAELASEIDVSSAQAALSEAGDDQATQRWAQARLQVAGAS